MRFTPTSVDGAFVIDIEPRVDARGFFARTFSADEFVEYGLEPTIVQSSVGFNRLRGTLRGLHFQAEPHGETKVLRCVRGSLFAVVADLRASSSTYLAHVGVELRAGDHRSLYVPRSCACGYQTLEDETEIAYDISAAHVPGSERGVHFDDPSLAVSWPLPVSVISDRDMALPLVGSPVRG